MSQLFEDSESDSELKTNNDYAKNYDTWRNKEELNKLKTKYGEVDLGLDDDESSSSEDDEVGVELTEEVEKEFYKTLALLKKKDPKIYDDNAVFFDKSENVKKSTKKSDRSESMYLKDYERKLLLEKGGIISDSDDDSDKIKEEKRDPTYVEQQRQLKENLLKAAEGEDGDNDQWGGLFRARQENKEEKEKKEADYKRWLAGQKKKLDDKETSTSLKPLKDYWGDPNLEDGEKFLRDYILNKRYLENENEDYIPTYDEVVHDSDNNFSEDESAIEKQEEFEHKYNFRFEEPDQEFIKRYPRTMENSLRKEDNRRKVKRVAVKERKVREKAEKMEELKKLRDLKRKEIEEKIEKLKEITGNNEMAFNDEDIDGDFDPEAHDKRMQTLFNDDFYQGAEEDQKPKFEMDDEHGVDLEIENFDNWTGNDEDSVEPHCEDEDFIMDADYDPRAAAQKELIDNTKKRKNRKKKSKFGEMLSKQRPNFDPSDKTYEEYIDEYYKLDCEDLIDGIPCRFKYRKVPPNSFGLTIEEILVAKDRELNKWCSLKKAVQIRPDHVEKYDQIAFSKKAQNETLKKKILPSLFMPDEEVKQKEHQKSVSNENKKKGKIEMETENDVAENMEDKSNINEGLVDTSKNKKKRKRNKENKSSTVEKTENSVLETGSVFKQNISEKKEEKQDSDSTKLENSIPNIKSEKIENTPQIKKKNKKRKKKKSNNTQSDSSNKNSSGQKRKHSQSDDQVSTKKFKKNKNKKEKSEFGLSDARLVAYGLNPKKFKNKVIYGDKNKNK